MSHKINNEINGIKIILRYAIRLLQITLWFTLQAHILQLTRETKK